MIPQSEQKLYKFTLQVKLVNFLSLEIIVICQSEEVILLFFFVEKICYNYINTFKRNSK